MKARTLWIKNQFSEQRLCLQARRNEIHIGGGAETRSEQSEKKWVSGGLAPGKFLTNTPFRSLENAPFLENVLLTEAKDHDQGESFHENFADFDLYDIKRYCIFDRFW